MILFLGETVMKIKKLEIRGLYGTYDYNVSFNDDLTFVYGENGCGKTTILDIVSSIVTGELYNLFHYKFDEIILSYHRNRYAKIHRIRIKAHDNRYDLSLDDNEKHETIVNVSKISELDSVGGDNYIVKRRFMLGNKFPRFLRETFNYIYLPLGRNCENIDNIDPHYRQHRIKAPRDKDTVNKNYLNESLRYVEEIIRKGCMNVNWEENKINQRFKSDIFTSSLEVTNEYSVDKLLKSISNKETLDSIEQNLDEYQKMLQTIGEWNEVTKERVGRFAEKYKAAFKAAQNKDSKGHHNLSIELLIMSMEFDRIKKIAAQAQEIEEEKEKARSPITSFVSTVNKFLSMGVGCKKITINNFGEISIETDFLDRKLTLYDLSSGEKQIIIIFACLVFGLSAGQSGIYIIDEPEASLHLAWQKIFVESIRDVNPSIQLIFATHAPEIIGRYSDYAVKLRRKVNLEYEEKTKIYDK